MSELVRKIGDEYSGGEEAYYECKNWFHMLITESGGWRAKRRGGVSAVGLLPGSEAVRPVVLVKSLWFVVRPVKGGEASPALGYKYTKELFFERRELHFDKPGAAEKFAVLRRYA